MDANKFISDYRKSLKEHVDKLDDQKIVEVIDLILKAGKADKQIFIAGNGGSAATASHMACDLAKTVLKGKHDTERLRIFSLSDNMPSITAISNDWHYDDIFVEQLKNLLNPGDLVILISGSGNSNNIVKAAEYAKSKKAIVVGFTGFDGGKLRAYCDYEINIPSDNYGVVEDLHMALDHMIAFCIKELKK